MTNTFLKLVVTTTKFYNTSFKNALISFLRVCIYLIFTRT